MEHDGLRIAMNVKSFVLSAGGRTCPKEAAMTSRRMQHPCDPSPTRTRQRACGESAPAEHDEHIRKKTDVVASHCCNRFKGRMPWVL